MESKKILVILGHPYKDSLGGKLAESYTKGAKKAGHDIKEVDLGELSFDPILHKGYKERQELEPDLVRVQEDIKWADHLVFVYPIWWGSFPALLKGFVDRTFLPGFGFKYHKDSPLWDRLLKGKSARLIMTMDGPKIFDSLVLCRAGIKIMKRSILNFCGVSPVRVTRIDKVRVRDDKNINKILQKVEKLGRQGK